MVPEHEPPSSVTAEFLDNEQYTDTSIGAYEAVYGEDFVSPGGIAMARELVTRLAPRADQCVLDAGCGLGGSAFLMAREFGLRVDGIDLSHNMIAMARARCDAHGLADRVALEHGDCLTLDRPQRYHAIYSRDVFLHIHDKARLFATLFHSLRPGGTLLFTDYCCSAQAWSRAFSHYVRERAYDLHSIDRYVTLIEAAGFARVTGADMTERFEQTLREELARIRSLADEQRATLEAGWCAKLDRVAEGEQRWGLFRATRPMA